MTGKPPHEDSLGRRILIADDNQDAAQSLAMLLEIMGHTTHVVGDGLATIEAAADFRPDLILLDLGMPRLDGLETCRRIRSQPSNSNVVVVALTGWTQSEIRRQSKEAGFDFYLVKPLDSEALEHLIRQVRPASAGPASN
jgi:CheY-like chemotaxis protein